MRQKVEEELKRMEEEDVIRPVKNATEWCVPIVVVPKSNGKVRICVDLTKLNESVRRENFPLPSTDQLLAHLSGAKVFNKLDCNNGFYQIPLHESQELTTFIMPFRRYCFKRLPFGISSRPEVFHREMTHILSGVPGVIVDINDVIISGRSRQEHDERLRSVLERMQEASFTLNEKCVFSVDTFRFLGHMISQEGIKVDPAKVEGYLRPSGNTRGLCFRQRSTIQLQSLCKFLRKLRFHPSYQQFPASPGKRWSWTCRADGDPTSLFWTTVPRHFNMGPAVGGQKTEDQGTDTTNSTCSWREGHEQVPGNWCSPETAAKDQLWSAS